MADQENKENLVNKEIQDHQDNQVSGECLASRVTEESLDNQVQRVKMERKDVTDRRVNLAKTVIVDLLGQKAWLAGEGRMVNLVNQDLQESQEPLVLQVRLEPRETLGTQDYQALVVPRDRRVLLVRSAQRGNRVCLAEQENVESKERGATQVGREIRDLLEIQVCLVTRGSQVVRATQG